VLLSAPSTSSLISNRGYWLLFVAGLLVPVSLLWDFSWESTVGVDLFWSAPHTLTYAAMALGAIGAIALMRIPGQTAISTQGASRFGPLTSPLGAWLVAWATLAFFTAVLFDRWWQSTYGLQAGIWHPPQILKATAFFAMLGGAWLMGASAQNRAAIQPVLAATLFSAAGGCVIVMIAIVTLISSYPNWQHAASFYKVAAATYPLVLAALATAGRLRWSATVAAAVYSGVMAGMMWLLPRFSARPLTGPIYNPLDHLMPPPFPLLLIVPALLMDVIAKRVRWPHGRGCSWLQAGVLGLAFFVPFFSAQWFFAEFLLSSHADNLFFDGGGRHWPFFLKISPRARVMFWNSLSDLVNWGNILMAAAFSMLSASLGLWLGAWLSRVRR
jgi:hypothetical protein